MLPPYGTRVLSENHLVARKEPMPTIQLDTVVRQGTDQLSCELDGETVLLSIQHGQYYYLNQVGSHIWTLLSTPHSAAALCAVLKEAYEVEPALCEQEVVGFLEALLTDDLLQVVA